jgi:hypothetical protein
VIEIAINIHRFKNLEFNDFGHEGWPSPQVALYSLIPEAKASFWIIIISTFLAKNYTVSKLAVYLTQIDACILSKGESEN